MSRSRNYDFFSNDEVIALIDACGLVPSSCMVPELVRKVRDQLNLRRASEVMSAEQEKEAHAFLEMVMARNRRLGRRLPD